MHHSKVGTHQQGSRRATGAHSGGQPTLAHVAAAAGVSQMTVSRVINGGPASLRTRQLVEQAVEELNYRPNQAARALAAKRRRHAPDARSAPFPDLWRSYEKFVAEMLKRRS